MNGTLYVHDLAIALGTTESAIRSMMRRAPEALPPHCRRGTRIYWKRSTVEQWEAAQEAATLAALPKKTGRPRAVPEIAESLEHYDLKGPAQSAAEPVYQYRVKYGAHYWSQWEECEKALHDEIIQHPTDRNREARTLYTNPPTVPPAIPADLREKVLELCELTLINGGPAGMVTAAMMQRAKAIREMMGEA